MVEERGRWQHELLVQKRMAELRRSALQRKEALLTEQLADARHQVLRLRWEQAKASAQRVQEMAVRHTKFRSDGPQIEPHACQGAGVVKTAGHVLWGGNLGPCV